MKIRLSQIVFSIFIGLCLAQPASAGGDFCKWVLGGEPLPSDLVITEELTLPFVRRVRSFFDPQYVVNQLDGLIHAF
ncbi:MAG: hypothetical protein AAF202_14130, partial [Pseudomonadota bacterium]